MEACILEYDSRVCCHSSGIDKETIHASNCTHSLAIPSYHLFFYCIFVLLYLFFDLFQIRVDYFHHFCRWSKWRVRKDCAAAIYMEAARIISSTNMLVGFFLEFLHITGQWLSILFTFFKDLFLNFYWNLKCWITVKTFPSLFFSIQRSILYGELLLMLKYHSGLCTSVKWQVMPTFRIILYVHLDCTACSFDQVKWIWGQTKMNLKIAYLIWIFTVLWAPDWPICQLSSTQITIACLLSKGHYVPQIAIGSATIGFQGWILQPLAILEPMLLGSMCERALRISIVTITRFEVMILYVLGESNFFNTKHLSKVSLVAYYLNQLKRKN